ncbi:MAG: hypothetical protein PHI12_06085 [Dehalococcoidales bacterium]|nr:hypothetical protein [Dehalococcoidales bacterium]
MELYSKREKGTTIHIEATIDYSGNLIISGQDVGELPRKVWGDDDYEYWLVVKPKYQEEVLKALSEHCDQIGICITSLPLNKGDAVLELLKQIYGGNICAFDEFRDLLKAKHIRAKFDSYV